MKKILLASVVVSSLITGCATVPMSSDIATNEAKEFKAPSPDTAGIYVYRNDSHFGAALKKDIWIDKECIGETAKGVFFYKEVEGNKEHTVSTESEFSPNDLIIKTESGQLYFVEQYIKLGAFVGGAGVEQKSLEEGKNDVSQLNLATKGRCSS